MMQLLSIIFLILIRTFRSLTTLAQTCSIILSSLKINGCFNADKEIKIFNKLYKQFDLVAEGWHKCQYRMQVAPEWSDFDFEMVISSKRDCKLLF